MTSKKKVLIAASLATSIFLTLLFFQRGTVVDLAEVESVDGLEETEEEEVSIDDPFLRGQYYFNADEDPSGPYDLEKAREAYEEAIIASSTENPLLWHQLGRIDFLEGKFDGAIYKFNKQVQYFGDTIPNVHYMTGLAYGYRASRSGNASDWQKAEEEFKKFNELIPDSPWARTDLAWIHFAQGEYEAMLPVLEEGLEYDPQHPWLNNMYGLALLNTGDRENARARFEQALVEAQKLSTQDWGKAYPGNDPDVWPIGLASFIDAIEKNIALVSD